MKSMKIVKKNTTTSKVQTMKRKEGNDKKDYHYCYKKRARLGLFMKNKIPLRKCKLLMRLGSPTGDTSIGKKPNQTNLQNINLKKIRKSTLHEEEKPQQVKRHCLLRKQNFCRQEAEHEVTTSKLKHFKKRKANFLRWAKR